MRSPIIDYTAKRTGLMDALSPDTLRVWQMQQIENALDYARQNNHFYAERLKDLHVHAPEDLIRIPFTTNEELIENAARFVCLPQSQIARIVSLYSSGTQAAPKRLYFCEEDIEGTVSFFADGMSTMVHQGQRVATFLPGPTPFSVADLLKKGLLRIGVDSLIVGVPDNIDTAIAAAEQADCLVGLASTMLRLSRTAPFLRPSSVLLSADYVPQSVVQAIKKQWGCAVLTHYGLTETCFAGGVQCMACEGHHMRDADIYVEIIDPKTLLPVPDGTWGEIVLTTFRHRAMPLFRYRTGDIGRMISPPCACGGALRMLGRVMGRMRSDVTLLNGSTLSIHALDEWIFACEGVIDYRAQLTGNKLHLSVEGNFDTDEVLAAIPPQLELQIIVTREECPVDIRASVQKRKLLVQPS